jgi:hypothetical protein
MKHPLYLLYAVLLLGVMGLAEYGGLPFLGAHLNEVKNVPKTVRDNPGAYRSIYGGYYSHYVGGK